MAHNDDPGDYSESDPTRYANYGGSGGQAYSEYDAPTYPQAPPPRTPWHQRPAALIALGVLSAAVLALLVYAVVKFVDSGTSSPAGPGVTSSTTAAPSSASSSPEPTATQSEAPAPTTQTVTVSPTEASITTAPPSPSATTSVTTVTETTRERLWPRLPRLAPPTLYQPPGQ